MIALSTHATTVYSELLSARAKGLEVSSLGKVWLEDLWPLTGLSWGAFGAGCRELNAQGSVVLSRDDMTDRPDALTVDGEQRIELAPERAEVE